jgi:hypothetical protein
VTVEQAERTGTDPYVQQVAGLSHDSGVNVQLAGDSKSLATIDESVGRCLEQFIADFLCNIFHGDLLVPDSTRCTH